MLQFVQIGVHMLTAHPMIRIGNGALQQAPYALDAVGGNVFDNPFFAGVINPFVPCVGILKSLIGRKFIGIDRFRVSRGVVVNELLQGRINRVFNHLQPNLVLALDVDRERSGWSENRDGRRRRENGYL